MNKKSTKELRTERNRLSGMSDRELTELMKTKRQLDESKKNKSLDPDRCDMPNDFVSMMLLQWPLKLLVNHTKLLLAIINRNRYPSANSPPLKHATLNELVYFSYPSEYAETLFADYTIIEYGASENSPPTQQSFRNYYNTIYREAKHALEERSDKMDHNERKHYITLLTACFIVSLMYDMRVRRFVFTKHDFHYKKMGTVPSSSSKVNDFLKTVKQCIDDFLCRRIEIDVLYGYCVDVWTESYMFRDCF